MKNYQYRHYRFDTHDPIMGKLHSAAKATETSSSEIRKETGVTVTGAWWAGKTKRPQFCTVAAVSGYLGLSLDKMLNRRNGK